MRKSLRENVCIFPARLFVNVHAHYLRTCMCVGACDDVVAYLGFRMLPEEGVGWLVGTLSPVNHKGLYQG